MPSSVVDHAFRRVVAPTGVYGYAYDDEQPTPQRRTDEVLWAMWQLLEADHVIADLDTQFYGPGSVHDRDDAYQPYPMPPRALVYQRELQRVNQRRNAARQQLSRLLGDAYGPRFNLNAETARYIQERRAAEAAAQA